jgi:tRNA dimethylallyltransferase
MGQRPIIVGGTGLYFSSLTRGLADIPEIPSEIRQKADQMRENIGREVFADLLAESDPDTYAHIDVKNPVRTQRAWEVLTATGKGLSKWQQSQQKPLIPENDAHLIMMVSETDWLNARIDQRFDLMIDKGALEECRTAMNSWWNENLPSCKAIGAKELISYLNNNLELTEAVEIAKTNSRRYAKKQRTWFRNRMQMWQKLDISDSNIDLCDII